MSRAGNADLLHVAVSGKSWPGGRQVLGAIHFSLPQGEVLAISGPSGCGKSTLLSIIAGLDHDFRGNVTLAGTPRLGAVFQTPRLLPWRTALENVALGRARGGGNPLQALAELGLADAADSYPARLSLGMAHRVALARALIREPDLLLLDEAMASLDAETAQLVRRAVLARVAARGMSVLMVTHDPRDSTDMADRLLLLGGSPATILQQRQLTGSAADSRGDVTSSGARRGSPDAAGFFPL